MGRFGARDGMRDTVRDRMRGVLAAAKGKHKSATLVVDQVSNVASYQHLKLQETLALRTLTLLVL